MPNARYGYVLATDEAGRVVWSSINDNNILPSQSGNIGLFLSTNGSGVYWADPSAGDDIIISAVSNNQTYYPVFASGSGVLTQAHIKSSFYPFSFNPSQNRLSVENSTINTLTIGSGNSGGIGQLSWNPDDGTLDLGLLGGNSTLQVGQELMARVFNDNGVQINDGEVVAINGAQGQRVSVIKAVASGVYSASHAFGLATENIPVGEEGFVAVFGTVRNLNTYINGSSEGAEIFLSPTTPGAWTTARPSAPNHAISLGFIQREHHSAGSIFVRVSTGEHLEYLHDVLITAPSSGQALIYDSSNSTWKNRTLNLASLNDTNITSPASGQVLTYDSSNSKWKNVAALVSSGTSYVGATGILVQGSQIIMGGTGELNRLEIKSPGGIGDMQIWRLSSGPTALAVGADGNFKLGTEDVTNPKIYFWDTNIADPDVWTAGITWHDNNIAFGEPNNPAPKLYFYNSAAGDYANWIDSGNSFTFYIDSELANLQAGGIYLDGVSAGGQQVKFYENTGSGSNFFALKSPPSLSSDITLILPSGAGTNGQVLTSSGNNNMMYWTTPAGTTYTAGSGLALIGSQFHLAGTGVLNKLTVNNQQSSNVPLVSKGAAAQSANLFEAQNVSGSNLVYIDKDGDIFSVGSGTFEFVQLNSSLTSPSGLLFLNPNKVVSHSPNVLFSNTNLSSPKLIFKASGSATPDISLNILTTASGSVSGVQTLSFEGSAGQLFSISDVLGSGTIFSVNDISGLPLIEADASGFVRLARFGADVEVYKQLELMPTGTTAGQTNELRFFELAASGQNYVGFKAPDSLAANRIWTLPTGDGASNQLLTTNGAGVLSWSTPVPTSGTATALNTTAVSTNATFYPVLSSGAGGGFAASIDTGLTYNPSTDMLTASGITANRIVGSANIIITESTTSRTLQAGDNGGVIMCTNNSGATLTLPTGLPVGFSVGVLAAATGVVSFTTSSTTLNNRQSHTKLAGQWAMGTVIQRTTNNFVLAGDTV